MSGRATAHQSHESSRMADCLENGFVRFVGALIDPRSSAFICGSRWSYRFDEDFRRGGCADGQGGLVAGVDGDGVGDVVAALDHDLGAGLEAVAVDEL